MKTTLNISDVAMDELRHEAIRQGKTISELVEAALRSFLDKGKVKPELPALPIYHTGGARVDIADRDALYDLMERETCS